MTGEGIPKTDDVIVPDGVNATPDEWNEYIEIRDGERPINPPKPESPEEKKTQSRESKVETEETAERTHDDDEKLPWPYGT